MADATIAPSGGDFTSAQGFFGDSGTGPGDTGTVEGDWSGGYDNTNCTVADDNITLMGKVGDQARTNGVEDTSGANYRLVCVTNGDHCIQVNNTGFKLDGLIIVQDSTGSSDEVLRMADDTGTTTLINSILRCDQDISDQDCAYMGNISGTANLENMILIGGNRCGANMQPFSGATTQTWNYISCTVFSNGLGNDAGDGGIGKTASNSLCTVTANCNNVISCDNDSGTNAADFAESGLGTTNWQIDNCISGDASITARDSGAVNANENIVAVTGNPASGELGFIDKTTAPYNLDLFDDSADNIAQDQHSNATGAGLTIGDYAGAVDIAGTTRPQNTDYDIGAFEVVSGAPPGATIPVFQRSYRNMRVN